MRRGVCLCVLLAALAGAAPAGALTPPSNARVKFDRYSLVIDGRRVVLNSGEIHYSRLPAPRAWPDLLARMKGAGLNAISIYVPWNYHEYAPGRFRYEGRYDLERFLRDARDAGLYVVARHGPYVQGEMDGGGYPPWLLGRPGVLRTADARFTAAWKAWNASVLPRIARWELGGRRRGTVVALQIENEHPGDGPEPEAYMADQYEDARRRGITVPILHNNQQLFGVQLAPRRFGAIVDLFGFDNYPYGFACCRPWNEGTFGQVDQFESFYRQSGGATRSPLYTPEIQGGIAPIAGDDGRDPEERYRHFVGYATVQQLSLLGQGLTMINQYMFFGGTTWGYTPFPNQGSSYDYAAPIREWTGLGRRFEEQRRLGLQMAAAERSLAATDRVRGPDSGGLYAVRRSRVDGGLHVVLRNADPGRDLAPTVEVDGLRIGPVPLPAQSARYLLARQRVGAFRLEVTTAETLSPRRGVLVLFGDRGRRYSAVVDGRRLSWTAGKARAIPFSGGRTVLLVDRFAAGRVWVHRGRVVIGPRLVTPDGAMELDRTTSVLTLAGGRLRATRVAGPPRIASLRLPSLRSFRFRAEAPERDPVYDDADWRVADRQTTTNQMAPLTRPVLSADAYEQPTGFVWYRGRFDGPARGVCLEGRHRYSVWLNGRHLRTVTSDAEVPGPSGLGGLGGSPPLNQPVQVPFPADAVRPAGNVLAVLTENWGHTMDAAAANQAKQSRGLISAALDRVGTGAPCGFTLAGSEFALFGNREPDRPAPPAVDGGIAWRLRGGRPADYPNASGLHGERSGWHGRSVDERGWRAAALPEDAPLGPGEVGWYRTAFTVRLPRGVRAPLGLELLRSSMPAEVFVNGVHVARAGRDRATRFVLPPGVVRTAGRPNTLAIARWAVGGRRMERPRLFAYEAVRRVPASAAR